MLRHEYLYYLLLSYALGIEDRNGRPTFWAVLGNVIRDAGMDASNTELLDTLKLLWGSGLLSLKKWDDRFRNFVEYSNDANDSFFFRGEFRLLATPKGRVYFEQLEAKVRASANAAVPVKQSRIGFHV